MRKRTIVGGALVALTLGAVLLASSPDRDLVFTREVQSQVPQAEISQAIDSIPNWVKWHHHLKDVKAQSPVPQVGEKVEFLIENPKRQWKRYRLTGEITAYEPGKRVAFKITEDSSQRLGTYFDGIRWNVEVVADPQDSAKTLVKGRLDTRTKHWRSRLYSRIAPRAFLNQIFFPDLIRLAFYGKPEALDIMKLD